MPISKSSSAAGRTGRRPVKAPITLALRLYFKEILSRNVKVTRALTGRRPVHPAADDDFEIYANS